MQSGNTPADTTPKPWIRWAVVIAAALGCWLSYDLIVLGFDGEPTNPWLILQCGGHAGGLDCQSVLRSRWGSTALSSQPGSMRIPVAAFGMGYFALIGVWYVFVGPVTRDRWGWHLPILGIVLIGGWESARMVGVMAFELNKWCAGCVATHAVNAVVILLTFVAIPWRRPKPPRRPFPSTRLALATCLAGLSIVLIPLLITLQQKTAATAATAAHAFQGVISDPEFVLWNFSRQTPVKIALDQNAHANGPDDAPFTVVVFGDLQCSACRRAHQMIEKVRAEFPNRLRTIFRHYPLDRACNNDDLSAKHPSACAAASAVEAAYAVAGSQAYDEFKNLIYERQDVLDGAPFADWASELGVERGAFTQARESAAVKDRIQGDIELAIEANVQAVPSLYLNGRRLHYWTHIDTWRALLRDTDEP